eukprot:scaffold350_cov333-Pavlova_lutheri.AAC.49
MSSMAARGVLRAAWRLASGQARSAFPAGAATGRSQEGTRSLSEGSKRGFAAGAHGKSITYEGLTLHEPSKAHKFVAYAMSSVMWCVSRPGWNQTRVRGRTSSASLTEQRT